MESTAGRAVGQEIPGRPTEGRDKGLGLVDVVTDMEKFRNTGETVERREEPSELCKRETGGQI